MDSKWRYAGVTIVLGSSLGAAAGLLAGQIASTLAIGIAMVGILIGSALARGAFVAGRSPSVLTARGDDQRLTTNDRF